MEAVKPKTANPSYTQMAVFAAFVIFIGKIRRETTEGRQDRQSLKGRMLVFENTKPNIGARP
jgi:hypothetical protein